MANFVSVKKLVFLLGPGIDGLFRTYLSPNSVEKLAYRTCGIKKITVERSSSVSCPKVSLECARSRNASSLMAIWCPRIDGVRKLMAYSTGIIHLSYCRQRIEFNALILVCCQTELLARIWCMGKQPSHIIIYRLLLYCH